MLRIVHFLVCTGHGGDALAALAIAEEQRRAGHQATIVIERSEHSAVFVARARANGVPTVEAPLLRHGASPPTHRRALSVWRTLHGRPADVVHAHTGGLFFRIADVVALRLLRAPALVGTVQAPMGWDWWEDSAQAQQSWRRAARGFDEIVAPGANAQQIQRQAGIDRCRVIHNPVAVDRIRAGDRSRARAELGLGDDDLLVLFMARLDEEKAPLECIRAFAAVAKAHPRAHLALAGAGALAGACADLVTELGMEGRVRLLGYRRDVADLYQAADIYLQPSWWESFGISFIEAMAAGCPVIATPVGVIPELGSGAVRLVERDDIDGMSCALDELLGSVELRAAYADRGRTIADRFDQASIARDYLSLYQSVLSTKRRTR